jgi:hypothetical protein
MMGNRSGRHALHCSVAAALTFDHLAVLSPPAPVLTEIAQRGLRTDCALVMKGTRRRQVIDRPSASASSFVSSSPDARLVDCGRGSPDRRPFSRCIRGVRPAFLDVSRRTSKASLLFGSTSFEQGHHRDQPFLVLARTSAMLRRHSREDGIEPAFLPLSTGSLPGFAPGSRTSSPARPPTFPRREWRFKVRGGRPCRADARRDRQERGPALRL